MPILLDTPLADVTDLPARVVKALDKEQVRSIADVIMWLPFRHEDRRRDEGAAFQPGDIPTC